MATENNVQHNVRKYRTDDGIYVKIFQLSRKNPQTGKYGFVDFVEFIIAGDPKQRPVQKLDATFIAKYPVIHKLWKEGVSGDDVSDETLITDWPIVNPNQALDLQALGISTVEALASLSDGQLDNIGMGARELRKKAQAYVEATSGDIDIAKMKGANQQLTSKVNEQQSQIDQLITEVKRLSAGQSGEHDDLPTEKNPVDDILSNYSEKVDESDDDDDADDDDDMDITPTTENIDPPVGELKISPQALTLLAENGIAPHSVIGTGAKGTITVADAKTAIEAHNQASKAVQGSVDENGRVDADITSDIAIGDPDLSNQD